MLIKEQLDHAITDTPPPELTGVHKKTTSRGGGFFGKDGDDHSSAHHFYFENVLPGIELFSQGATPQISSPLMRFTTEFEMDRSGTTPLWTPG